MSRTRECNTGKQIRGPGVGAQELWEACTQRRYTKIHQAGDGSDIVEITVALRLSVKLRLQTIGFARARESGKSNLMPELP